MSYNEEERDAHRDREAHRHRQTHARDDDKPRRRFSIRRRRPDAVEGEDAALGGWRPIGEALFWGVIFLALTVVAFALGSGGKPKDAADLAAEKPAPPPKQIDPAPSTIQVKRSVDVPGAEEPIVAHGNAAELPQERHERTNISDQFKLAAFTGWRHTDWQAQLKRAQLGKPSEPIPQLAAAAAAPRWSFANLFHAAALVPSARRTDIAGQLRRAEFAPAPIHRELRPLLRWATVLPATARLEVASLFKSAALAAPGVRTNFASLFKAAAVAAPDARTEIARLYRAAALAPPDVHTDIVRQFKPAAFEPAPTHLAWREMLRTAEFDPDFHRTEMAFLRKRATFVPATTHRDLPSLVKLALLEPGYRRTPTERLAKTVRLIPLPTPEPLTPKMNVAALPVSESVRQPLPAAAAAEPAALVLRPAPRTHRLGKRLVLVAKVLGRDQQPLADQLVEWNVDRNGVGRIAATPQDARIAKPGEKPLPTFARTWTAGTPHRVPSDLGELDIQAGETWIAVETDAAGTMLAVAEAPRVAASAAGRATARIHWDHAGAKFPGAVRAQAGTSAAFASRVGIDGTTLGDALPYYRVRYTLTEPHGAAFENGQTAFETESGGDGQAPATLRQALPQVGPTRGKAELLGRNPLSGEPAVTLATGEFSVEWLAPQVTLQPRGPSVAPAGEPAAIKVAGSVAEPQFAKGLRLWALPAADLRLQGGDRGQALDLGDFPALDGRPLDAVARLDQQGVRAVRFEVRAGQHVWASAQHEINFAAPELSLAVDVPERWADGDSKALAVKAVNKGLVAARNVRARLELPAGWRFENVEEGTTDGGAAVWLLDHLDAGATKSFKLRARAAGEGKGFARATAEALAAAAATAEAPLATAVVGAPNLQMEITDRGDPVKLGAEFEYVIVVRNAGAVAARGARIVGSLPEGIVAVSASGTLPAKVENGRLALGTLPEIPPGGRLETHVKAKATSAGKVVFAAQLRHASLGPDAARCEESTVAY